MQKQSYIQTIFTHVNRKKQSSKSAPAFAGFKYKVCRLQKFEKKEHEFRSYTNNTMNSNKVRDECHVLLARVTWYCHVLLGRTIHMKTHVAPGRPPIVLIFCNTIRPATQHSNDEKTSKLYRKLC